MAENVNVLNGKFILLVANVVVFFSNMNIILKIIGVSNFYEIESILDNLWVLSKIPLENNFKLMLYDNYQNVSGYFYCIMDKIQYF